MAMQIHGNYDHFGTDRAEWIKEKQAVPRAEKEAEKAAEEKTAGKQSELRVEYISSEKSGQKPTGLYRIGQDDKGNRKLFFDAPKAGRATGKDDRFEGSEDGKAPKVSGDSQGKPAKKCITNTDKVDREIRKLKEKKQQLKQQIQWASGDEKKIRELEKKLAQVENELSQKDNDTYRRQNASVSE